MFLENIQGEKYMGKSKMKRLQEKIHNIAIEKGFWNKISCDNCNSYGQLDCGDYWETCEICNGKGYILDRNNAELLMLIVSELGEACEALRKNNWDNFKEELADTMIRLFDMAEGLNIDLEKEILKKVEKNKKRPYKHGKQF